MGPPQVKWGHPKQCGASPSNVGPSGCISGGHLVCFGAMGTISLKRQQMGSPRAIWDCLTHFRAHGSVSWDRWGNRASWKHFRAMKNEPGVLLENMYSIWWSSPFAHSHLQLLCGYGDGRTAPVCIVLYTCTVWLCAGQHHGLWSIKVGPPAVGRKRSISTVNKSPLFYARYAEYAVRWLESRMGSGLPARPSRQSDDTHTQ